MSSPPPNRARVLAAYAVFCAVLLVAVSTPLVLGGRLEPFVLGLPFAIWWTAGWVVSAFLVLATVHVLAGGERE